MRGQKSVFNWEFLGVYSVLYERWESGEQFVCKIGFFYSGILRTNKVNLDFYVMIQCVKRVLDFEKKTVNGQDFYY